MFNPDIYPFVSSFFSAGDFFFIFLYLFLASVVYAFGVSVLTLLNSCKNLCKYFLLTSLFLTNWKSLGL